MQDTMMDIEFDADYSGKFRHVKLASNHYGGGGYQILIDNWYHGELLLVNGKWRAHLNAKSELNSDDIGALIDRIAQERPK